MSRRSEHICPRKHGRIGNRDQLAINASRRLNTGCQVKVARVGSMTYSRSLSMCISDSSEGSGVGSVDLRRCRFFATESVIDRSPISRGIRTTAMPRHCLAGLPTSSPFRPCDSQNESQRRNPHPGTVRGGRSELMLADPLNRMTQRRGDDDLLACATRFLLHGDVVVAARPRGRMERVGRGVRAHLPPAGVGQAEASASTSCRLE